MERLVIPAEGIGQLSPAWRKCVGTGRMALALRADYRESLKLVQHDIGFEHIRGHGLFSHAMGILRDSEGVQRCGFTYLDEVIDSYLDLGIKPFLELGFMPHALASGEQTLFWWKANVTPPKDHGEWAALVSATVKHLISRYGLDEVRDWPIEVWNEPNLDAFWAGADMAAYFKLYATSVQAIKEVDAELQVGGPAVAPRAGEWYEKFAAFVTDQGLPCDFFSAHAYSSKPIQPFPFGVYQGFYPSEDLLEQFAIPGQVLAGTPLEHIPVHITEYNTSYDPLNPIHDTAYNAAYLAPVVANGGDLVDSFSYWTFCDVFEEQDVPTSIFHGGFGLMTIHQLRKPTYHLYAFMARMGSQILARGEDHLVTRHDDGRVTILAWQPVGDPDAVRFGELPASHQVGFEVPLPGAKAAAFIRRSVGEEAGNAWAAWRELGRPMAPSRRTMDLLREASAPAVTHGSLAIEHGQVNLDLTLGRHEVTLVEVLPVTPDHHEGLDDSRLLGHEPR
ncbi:MAG: hypothetical protein LBR27_04075 [Bifidobacteriaceae bacterium]|jgi:xylan 1,4-beta-xylosidase|nr:hypothetical protein [Bifidobacteriaceae bacterium]